MGCNLRFVTILSDHLESHTSGGGLPSYDSSLGPFPSPVPTGEEVTSKAREVRLFIGWNFFFGLNVLSICIPYAIVSQVMLLRFFENHNDGMLLHIMGVIFTSSFLYLDIVLSLVITLYLFCHNDGWLLHTRIVSYGGYAFFQAHKNLK